MTDDEVEQKMWEHFKFLVEALQREDKELERLDRLTASAEKKIETLFDQPEA